MSPFKNRVTALFGIDYPIIQAGMIWASGWRLASAVSNAGGLGVIGSGSMYPNVLKEHIQKCKSATIRPFAVNVPLLYPGIDKHIQIIIEEEVKIVFTSAGNPKTWTSVLKEKGITVVHVVSSSKFALKAQDRAIRAEENLRFYAITGKLMDNKLSMKQIIALRFAPNNELLDLEHRAVEENLSPSQIKKAIKHWRADNDRV